MVIFTSVYARKDILTQWTFDMNLILDIIRWNTVVGNYKCQILKFVQEGMVGEVREKASTKKFGVTDK